jgi:hypothetical protein
LEWGYSAMRDTAPAMLRLRHWIRQQLEPGIDRLPLTQAVARDAETATAN